MRIRPGDEKYYLFALLLFGIFVSGLIFPLPEGIRLDVIQEFIQNDCHVVGSKISCK